jgi:Enolase C-terminal domain-like
VRSDLLLGGVQAQAYTIPTDAPEADGTALWDLKAKLLGVPLATLLGRCRDRVEIYGSGGFTSYDDHQMTAQLVGWVERDGCRAVKMKIGTHPDRDPARVALAKQAIGDAHLFVDANGAYTVKQAIALARIFAAEQDVRWFEEPVSSDDLDGMHRVRDHVPAPWILLPASMATSRIISGGCWRRAPLTSSKPMPHGAAASPASCSSGRCARRSIPIFQRIVPRPYTGTWAAPCRASGMWSGSTIMSASRPCCSTGRPNRKTAPLRPTPIGLALV